MFRTRPCSVSQESVMYISVFKDSYRTAVQFALIIQCTISEMQGWPCRIGGMILTGENRSAGRKRVTVAPNAVPIIQGMAWN